MSPQSSVAGAVVQLLAAEGVRRAYAVPGESFLPLLDALEVDSRIELISARHEGGASFMAEADGKLTGMPAVALGSRGPGAANMTIGVHTAFQDETPMVVILGQVATTVRGREAFQEVDLASFYSPIAKWAREAAAADEVVELLADALAAATTGRRGPVVLAVPSDLWKSACSMALPEARHPDVGDPGELVRGATMVAELVRNAEHPVAIVGGGAAHSSGQLVPALEALAVPVYNAFRRQGVFPEDHPQYAGHLGIGVPAALLRPLDEADLIVALGSRLDEITSQNFRYPRVDQRLVSVGQGASSYRQPGTAMTLDVPVAEFLRAIRRMPFPQRDGFAVAHAAFREFGMFAEPAPSQGIHPGSVVRSLRELVPVDTIVTNDAGNFAGFLHRYWCYADGVTQLAPANGAMGYAIPAAVAAKIAAPERAVVAMVGDGGLLMTGQEIETAVRLGAGVVVVAFQNHLYGTIAMHQARAYGRLAGVHIGPLDLAGWARGLGAVGLTVDRPDELIPVLRRALSCGRPCVVDVRTNPDQISPDTTLSTLIEGHRGPAENSGAVITNA
jgi:acetolactate synthase-1/2/3 large subunit